LAGAVAEWEGFEGQVEVADDRVVEELGGPNPTLTTQAVATRTAEHIFAKYFDGDPWVGTESPVSSLDDRVTQGVLDGGLA
jgi:hypothetical protein